MFSFLRKRPAQQVRVINRDVSRVTMAEWSSNLALVKAARKHLDDPELRLMLDVLRFQGPHTGTLPLEAPTEHRAVWQARIEGYQAALNDLESLGNFYVQKSMPEPTYEPEQRETETQ